MTRIVQFGATGQVAVEMQRRAQARGVDLVPLARADADLTDADAVTRAIETAGDITAVVNAAAYTAVDAAEDDREAAFAVNAAAPEAMAKAAAARGVPIVHISTDYVYPGDKDGPYVETDATGPVSVYGASKLAGEKAVAAANRRHLIIRTAWVYAAHGKNFVKTMLRLGAQRGALNIVDDQQGCPTFAGDIAETLLALAARGADMDAADPRWGVYHYAGAGATTWRKFAEAAFEDAPWAGVKAAVTPIPTSAYPTPAHRPANSVLDCAKIQQTFGVAPRPWRDALGEVLAELRTAHEETVS